MIRITDRRGDVRDQGYNVTLSVLYMFAHNSTKESRTSNKIGRLSEATRVTLHTSSKVRGQGHQAAKCRDRKSAVSSEREGLRASNSEYEWSTKTFVDMRDDHPS